jgi:hypothetical protein
MKEILLNTAVMGVATLASAALLQKGYEITKFYPPKPVFWFFSGFNAHLVISLVKKYLRSADTDADVSAPPAS